jgi:hypothetical protein
MGYLIKKQVKEIVTAKITLTAADLLTPGFIVDIPEYSATTGYFWQVLYMNGNIVNGAIPYAGSSAIHVQASTALNLQYRFTGAFMNGAVNNWIAAGIPGGSPTIQYVVNDGLQIHNPGILTTGDTELIIYLGAILIQQ